MTLGIDNKENKKKKIIIRNYFKGKGLGVK